MKNVWLLKAELVEMPTNLTDDREIELTYIRMDEVNSLRDYWLWHHDNGSINRQEFSALIAVIEYQCRDTGFFETRF
jgi:hypothetical protein